MHSAAPQGALFIGSQIQVSQVALCSCVRLCVPHWMSTAHVLYMAAAQMKTIQCPRLYFVHNEISEPSWYNLVRMGWLLTEMQVETVAPYSRWYERFKGALESLESKQQQQQSPLPIIYQWQQPQPAHSSSKYGPANALYKASGDTSVTSRTCAIVVLWCRMLLILCLN